MDLHYADHHCGFSYVVPLKNKSAKEVGQVLLTILYTAVILEVLLSNNRKEFLGFCVGLIREYSNTM